MGILSFKKKGTILQLVNPKSMLRRILSFKKEKQLRGEDLRQRLGENVENICISIIDREYEVAMAKFSTFCLSFPNVDSSTEQQFLNRSFANPAIIEAILKSKERYYEFFLAMVNSVGRVNLSNHFYKKWGEESNYIRETIALTDDDMLETQGIFRDRIHEWTLILERRRFLI